MVKRPLHILIADRNPHVREFIKRETAADGHRIDAAENGRELLRWVYRDETIDLIILDPDLPDAQESSMLARLQDRLPCIPVVFHAFLADYPNRLNIVNAVAYIEKGARSIEQIKTIIADIQEKRIASGSVRNPKRRESDG